MTRARAGAAIVAATVVLIAFLTLAPALSGDQESRWCIVCGRRVLGDALLNIALFIPLGLGLALLGIPRRRALAVALLATVAIELTQGFLLRGRFASVSDIVTNTAGAFVGHALADHWRALLFPSTRVAARRGGGLLLLWLAIIGFAAWALTPTLAAGRYRVVLPEHGGTAGNADVVRSAELYRTLDDHGPLEDSASIASAVQHRQLLLLTRFDPPLPVDDLVAAAHLAGTGPVITIEHGEGRSSLAVRARARAFFLHEPMIFGGPVDSLPRSRDSLVAIAAGVDGAEIRMFFLRDSAVAMEARLPIVPALWPYLMVGVGPAPNFLLPFSALLNAMLLAPAAFWIGSAAMTARERRRRWGAAAMSIVVATMAIGYGVIPVVARLVETPVEIWVASLAAVVTGWMTAAATIRWGWHGSPPRIPS